MNDFKILTPVIGGFSAGKTLLLNSYLEENILKVDILPETTIATELRYSCEGNKLNLYKNEKDFDEFSLDKPGTVQAKNYLYQVIYLNNNKLKNQEDIILVDMPGLDSGLEIHNKSILNYIKYGTFYIVVVDIEDGTLKQSTLNFINEILGYNLEISIIINKIDKKSY